MVSEGAGGALGGKQSLSPSDARKDAADRRLGRRMLLILRVLAIIAAVTFGTVGILTDPEIAGGIVESEAVQALTGEAFAVLGVAGLGAMIFCRRPACQQVPWLKEAITASGVLAIIVGGIGLVSDMDGIYSVVFAVSVVSGLTTLILRYVWRVRKVPR